MKAISCIYSNNANAKNKRFFQKILMLKNKYVAKVRLFLDRSCAILSFFKIVVIFNTTSADFVLISADFILKMIRN